MSLSIIKKSKDVECVRSRLEVSDLRKSFVTPAGERLEVLRGIDLEVSAGEAIAVTGPSGSGKSTLLQLLGGLDEPDHGTISLNAFTISCAGEKALARFRQQRIGFIFQFHHLLADLSAVENVALPLLISRKPSRSAMVQAVQALDRVKLGSKRDFPVNQLSGGEQQRLAVARALILEPELVLADEPTGNLDSAIGEEITDLLLDYARIRGAIVIIATHNRKLAQHCDRILAIHEGKLIATLSPAV